MNDTPIVATRVTMAEAAPRAMVYIRDRDSEGILRQCLSDLGVEGVSYINSGIETAIADLAHRPSPRLLIVDVSGAEDPVSRVKELAQVCGPSTGVVVIGDVNDVVLYRSLKSEGVVEYYFKPLFENLVSQTCNFILTGKGEQPASRTGKLVFVMGARGGAGATSIAAWAAWYLAEVHHRHVLLFDLDLNDGDAALQLDVTPNEMLRQALEQPERVDDLFLERGVIHVTSRLDLLASLEPLDQISVCREDVVLSLIAKLLNRYRYIFVDMPPSLAPQLLRVLQLPSTLLLVSNSTLVAARDVARWREKIGPNTADRLTLHVVNKGGAPGSLPMAEFVRAIGQAPDVIIPYEREIGMASILGVKGFTRDGALSRALAPVLRHITGQSLEENRSFLSRLFG